VDISDSLLILCVKALSDLFIFSLTLLLKLISIDLITIRAYWILISSVILVNFVDNFTN
jgi:hypothetical protein